MFDATIEKSTLETTLDSVSVLVDECKIHLNEDGIAIRAVDPANVGMVDLELSSDVFESYDADGGIIGVNLTRLEDVVGMADSGDLVHLDLNEETRKLHIEIDGLEYTLALIDPDSIRDEPDLPDLDLAGNIILKGADLGRALKASDMVSDHVLFRIDQDAEQFVVEAEGDTDDVDLKLGRDDLIDLTVGDANSMFSLDYLKDMNKAIDKKAEIEMELGAEFPVKMHINFGEDDAGLVTYLLAPRIQSD